MQVESVIWRTKSATRQEHEIDLATCQPYKSMDQAQGWLKIREALRAQAFPVKDASLDRRATTQQAAATVTDTAQNNCKPSQP